MGSLGKRKYELRDQLNGSLKQLGLTAPQIKDANQLYNRYMELDLARAACLSNNAIGQLGPRGDEYLAAVEQLVRVDADIVVGGTQELRALTERFGLLNAEREEELRDLDHYRTTGAFREGRPRPFDNP